MDNKQKQIAASYCWDIRGTQRTGPLNPHAQVSVRAEASDPNPALGG